MSHSEQLSMMSGAFARRTRLSPKALRLYDDMGLLCPAWVDPSNGYRYYDESQVATARLIGLLRTLGMPLTSIREVISLEESEAITVIGGYWEGVETDHQTRRELVRHLVQRLSGKGNDMYEVEQRTVPEQQVASIEERVYAGELPAFIERGLTTVYQLLSETDAKPGIPFVLYHGEVNLDSDGPVEVCVPYEGTALEPHGTVRLRIEPAHNEAFTRITKRQVKFPRILDAYAAVEAWVQEHGHSVFGSPREVYFVDWSAVGDDDPACDIAFPYT
jgi:DNA-binding transcriptional MerR regulator